MDGERLRALQAPLKAKYKDDPASATVTLCASGRVAQAALTCTLETGKPGVAAGLHPAAGGDASSACSGEMLLEALVACAGVTLAAVSTSMGIELAGGTTVLAEGDLDFRGTLGVARDAPVGFTSVRMIFTLESAAPADKLNKLVELTERYCVVFQTLAKPPAIEVRLA
jgi:uncharacterized OsmC-like protein